MSISRRKRFEVFRRDGYACQYCGRRAPAVTLEVDHRISRHNGGTDEPENLVAACWDCNRGKGPLNWDHGYQEPLEVWKFEELYERETKATIAAEWVDEGNQLPRWLRTDKGPQPIHFDFDVYAVAAEMATPDFVLAMTAEAFDRKAGAF